VHHNLFARNRHDIKSSGRPSSSYVATGNVSLGSNSGHLYDVHGCEDYPDECRAGSREAGDWFVIRGNYFLDPYQPAIRVRGVPRVGVEISGNYFASSEGRF
jgi:hypothetical protein